MAQPLIPITRTEALLFAGFLVLYEFLTYIANDMIMPGMIDVVNTFNGRESDIATSLTLYILGGASLQLFLGPLSDAYGRRPIMLTGAVVFFVFTVWIACSSSMHQFLIARFFEGMGLCFISVIGYATLQEIFEEMDAIRLMAMMSNISILAPLLGPLAGALFVHYFNWRFIFVMIAAFALISLLGLAWKMPESVGQTKRDGSAIPRVPLSPKTIMHNYKRLSMNRSFMLASMGLGLAGLPCVAWIGLAPVILVTVGKLSLMEYGIWQIPIFGAIIAGNMTLRRLTHTCSLEKLLKIGSLVLGSGLALMLILQVFFSTGFVGLIPGLMLYFFGLGIVGSPLSRFVLFSTQIAKGTASALMSMILMSVQAIGVQFVNLLYSGHSNFIFSFYCFAVGVIYLIVMYAASRFRTQHTQE